MQTPSLTAAVRAELLAHPDVSEEEHSRGGIVFRLGRRELGHLPGETLPDPPPPGRESPPPPPRPPAASATSSPPPDARSRTTSCPTPAGSAAGCADPRTSR